MQAAKELTLAEGIEDLSREQLLLFIKDLSKRWLAHDGLWFQAIEQKYGMEAAIEMDRIAWEKFTVIEARRITEFLQLPQEGGLPALARALRFRLYSSLNEQEIVFKHPKKMIFQMKKCRVQMARKRKNLPDFPCKSVGIIEYSGFARTIDQRIKTTCLNCPPDRHSDEYYCAWEFTVE